MKHTSGFPDDNDPQKIMSWCHCRLHSCLSVMLSMAFWKLMMWKKQMWWRLDPS